MTGDLPSKEVTFNQRILKNEEEISGINVDLADFLQGMSMIQPSYSVRRGSEFPLTWISPPPS
jgi:hypothetical protein